ncbi:unnamed protein product [Oppiella nova]|uniref:Uncharacterized protein n=1 Tax=Oppiella nova TaxID=334625 RepID=A0A7R9MDY4_9ACAR|nr:unnamed protein product [Oppiella nova]CAG2174609.1 unnamed protein product [Oppiella nova]
MFIILCQIFFISYTLCQGHLIFRDEFNSTSLDTNKWLIQYGEDSCTAVRRHLYSKNYTTAQIISKYIFRYGNSLNDGIFCDDLDAIWLDPVFKVEYVRRLKGINREMVSDVYDDNRMDDYEECDYNIDHKYEEPYDTIGNTNNVDPDGAPIYLEITNTTPT